MDLTRRILVVSAAASIALASVVQVRAAPILVTDANTTIEVDPTSDSGLFTWRVDGVDQMVRQWFWFSVASRRSQSSQIALSELDLYRWEILGDSNNILRLVFAEEPLGGAVVTVQVDYTVVGGPLGSGRSTIFQRVVVDPEFAVGTDQAVEGASVNWIQYTDLNLRDHPNDNRVESASKGRVTFVSGNRRAAIVNDSEQFELYGQPPVPVTNFEVSDAGALLDRLRQPVTATLSNTVVAGPGDLAHAVQYDDGGGFGPRVYDTVMRTEVPEPASALLTALGVAGFMALCRVRHRHASGQPDRRTGSLSA